MSKSLIIAEKPSVAADIAKALGGFTRHDDYFEGELLKGLLSSSSIIGTKVGPRSQGSGVVLLFHNMGEQDGVFGRSGPRV